MFSLPTNKGYMFDYWNIEEPKRKHDLYFKTKEEAEKVREDKIQQGYEVSEIFECLY